MHEAITSRTGTKHFAIFLFLNEIFVVIVFYLVLNPSCLFVLFYSTLLFPLHLISIRAWRSALVRPAPLPHSPPSLRCLHFIPPLLGIDDITGPCVVPALFIPPLPRGH